VKIFWAISQIAMLIKEKIQQASISQLSRESAKIVFDGVLYECPVDTDTIIPARPMYVALQTSHHEVEYLSVLRKHDVRPAIKRPAIPNGRSAVACRSIQGFENGQLTVE
jgi:hypothetical protein